VHTKDIEHFYNLMVSKVRQLAHKVDELCLVDDLGDQSDAILLGFGSSSLGPDRDRLGSDGRWSDTVTRT
jgi:hypothetical protein